jgi:signal transduction histidine kinase/ActR/RegA family two-component response regulator
VSDLYEDQWTSKLRSTRLKISEAFLENNKFSEVVDHILQAVCQGMGLKLGALWVYKLVSKKSLKVKNVYCDDHALAGFYRQFCDGLQFVKGQGIPGMTWDQDCLCVSPFNNDSRFEDSVFRNRLDVNSSISFSIGKGREFYGVMEFFSADSSPPDSRLHYFLSDMGSLLAQYVHRCEAEQQLIALNFELEKHVEARTRDLAKAMDREKFFSAASTELASSLDYKTTIQKIAQLAVPQFADCCIVNMIDEAGNLPIIAVSQSDDRTAEILKEIDRKYPINFQQQFAMSAVVRLGHSILDAEMAPEAFTSVAKSEEHLKLLNSLNLVSYLCAPLRARGKIIGAITLALSSTNPRRYQKSDLIFIEDLADRAALAIDNAKLFSEVQSSNKIKDEFLATLSHELRTPLNVIQGWVSILKSENLNQKDFALAIEMLDRNTSLQARLINDLLDVSRIVTGKLSMEYKQVDIASVLKTSVDSVRPAATAKSIVLTMNFDAEGYFVWGDYSNLQRVFVNIFSNAIKFTNDFGSVAVELIIAEHHIEVLIKDSGQGITSEFLPYIFESFRQEDSSTTRPHQGLGLGLAIAQHIASRHRGFISVKSEGKELGSEFRVSLPLYHTVQHTREFLMAKELESQHLVPTDVPAPLEKMLAGVRVLLVDDANDMLVLLSRFLKRSGAEVIAVSSAREACDYLKRNTLDILISDIGMPEEDGYCLIEKVRRLAVEEGGLIPAIALTAYARDEEKKRVLAAGFTSHLSKPVQHRVLVETIYKTLNSDRGVGF